MKLEYGNYILISKEGGIEVQKNGKLLYFNKRPMFVTVKTAFAVNEFYDQAYTDITASGDKIVAEGTLTVPTGSAFFFTDVYEAGFKVSRNVKVLKAECLFRHTDGDPVYAQYIEYNLYNGISQIYFQVKQTN